MTPAGAWLLRALPLRTLAALGRVHGRWLYQHDAARRSVALKNITLCLPALTAAERGRLLRDHFAWLGRHRLERAVLRHAGAARLKRLIHVDGDVQPAQRSERGVERGVMWLLPNFIAVEAAAVAVQLFQAQPACHLQIATGDAEEDAAQRRSRGRFSPASTFMHPQQALATRQAAQRLPFFAALDGDFGRADAAFVPFFDHPAATLLAPSQLARAQHLVVQPVIAEALPDIGWRVRFLPPWTDWPGDDPVADMARVNRFVEDQIRLQPAQYAWTHRRFGTRPEGAPPLYG